MRVLFLVVIGLAVTAALIDHETKEEFKDFLSKFGKHYDNPIEFAKRQAIFAKNKLKRIAHNLKFAADQVGWEEEVNEFSDMTAEEFLKHLGYVPDPRNGTDDGAIPASVYYSGQNKRFGQIDWRSRGKVGAVKNQGGCGSCWTFSAVAVIESCVAISSNSGPPDLSEQQFQDCLHSKVCSPGGGWPANAIDNAKNGLATEAEYPYVTRNGNCHAGSRAATVGSRISGKGEGDLERLLSSGVVSVALDASTLQGYRSGVIDAASSGATNHAVTVVALSTDCAGRSQECWVVKNSWGAGWGEKGYFRVVKGKNSIGVANVCDTAVNCNGKGGDNNPTPNPKPKPSGTDRPGGDMPNQPKPANNKDDCANRCRSTNGCKAWAFDTCGNNCWLKSMVTGGVQRECRDSGTR